MARSARTTTKAPTRAAIRQERQTFQATVVVTRTEEWCVEAASADEARALLAAGQGYRCQIGDRLHLEVETLHDPA